MNAIDIPLPCAALLGIVIGLLLFGPLRRWVITFGRTLRERRQRRGAQRQGTGALLLIFATLHPAPWLLLIGLPYGIFALWNDPLRVLWGTVLAGALLGPAALALYEAARRRAGSAAHGSAVASPDA